MQEMNEKRAALVVMLGAFLISFSGVYVKLADVGPSVAGFYRLLFGGGVLLLLALLQGRSLHCPRLDLAVLCGLFFALDLYVWHKSIHLIGPGLATILGNFQVFVLALVGRLQGESINLRFMLAVMLALSGLFMMVGIDWQSLGSAYQLGVGLGLLTAICYSGYTVVLRRVQLTGVAPAVSLIYISLAGAALLALLAAGEGESFIIPDRASWASLLAYGIFSQVMGWALIARALPHIRISLAGLLLLLQPALSFGWDMIFFARPTSRLDLLGVMLALAAIYLGVISRSD